MAPRHSAGILLYRTQADDERPEGARATEVLIGHMGGPFWRGRDTGAWSVPKGELDPQESPETAARREFAEELGLSVPEGDLVDLGSSRQSGGKVVSVWALAGDLDVARVRPGTFEMEWPPRSGQRQEFPEIDVARWFEVEAARERLVAGQRVFLDRLIAYLATT